MRVFYLTRANLRSNSAHAGQILAMSRAYYNIIGDDFKLFSPGRLGFEKAAFHRPITWYDSQWLRYLAICGRAVGIAIAYPDGLFLTRDIAIALVVALMSRKVVYEAHSKPASRIPELIFGYLAGKSQFKLVCISKALAEYYQARFSIPDGAIRVAHSGVFPEAYYPIREYSKMALRQKLGLPSDKLVIVHTGSLYKGGAELFGEIAAAWSELIFVHLGGEEQECKDWAEHYRDLGIGNIFFIAHRSLDTVREFQVAADVLFYISTKNSPIYWCTSPLKLFEYMASGTPILGANLGSVAEVFDESVGFCFDPERPETMIQSFEYCLDHPDEAELRAKKALLTVEQKYSWHRRARAILDFAFSN